MRRLKKMLCAVFLIATGVGLLYLHFVWNFGYWKKRGVPGPKPIPIIGAFPGSFMQKRNLTYEVDDIYQ